MFKIISASLIAFFAFLIPSFSTIFLVALMPAVSKNITGAPFKLTFFSITSLVVPGIFVTIDFCFLII